MENELAPIPKVLYHYTTQSGFEGIINSKRLWLTNPYHCNDKKECVLIDELIMGLLPEIFRQYVNIPKYAVERIKQGFYINRQIATPLMCCLAVNGDLKSQWLDYAEKATGLSIGFNPEYFNFQRFAPSLMVRETEHSFAIEKVIYDVKSQNYIIKSILDNLKYIKTNDLSAPGDGEFAIYIQTLLLKFAFILKHKGFYEEAEWRIMYTPPLPTIMGMDTSRQKIKEIKERNVNGVKSPYVELAFDEKKVIQPISVVNLGPKCDKSVEEIEQILIDNDFRDIQVTKSEIPYR